MCVRNDLAAVVNLSALSMRLQVPMKLFADTQHLSFIRQESHSSPIHRIRGDAELDRLPSTENFTVKRSLTIDRLDDNIVPQSFRFVSSMIVTESTRIGQILCSYLPYMADAYFQYCSCRAQADKYLQAKMALNKQFRSYLKIFQSQTGGLSLNGYLTKPIQRVTRYPLLIEKILKHTGHDHPDRQFIQQAYDCARQLNERINKQIREQENSLRLDWLQQHFSFSTDENLADDFILDETVRFNTRTKFHTRRQLLLHGCITKVSDGGRPSLSSEPLPFCACRCPAARNYWSFSSTTFSCSPHRKHRSTIGKLRSSNARQTYS